MNDKLKTYNEGRTICPEDEESIFRRRLESGKITRRYDAFFDNYYTFSTPFWKWFNFSITIILIVLLIIAWFYQISSPVFFCTIISIHTCRKLNDTFHMIFYTFGINTPNS